jgi:hypothetical protein
MNLTKLITDYDRFAKLKNTSSTKAKIEEKKIDNKDKPKTKANKLTDLQLSSIMYTNEQYKKKMFKAKNVPTYETFGDKESFNSFIDNGISEMKKLTWKQMPFSFKLPICKEFILNDDDLSEEEKEAYILKIDSKNISKAIVYDKEANKIKNIDYKLLI